MKRQVSNYELQCEQWRCRFLEWDQAALTRKLPELKPEGEYLTLRHFGRKLGIHRQEGHIVAFDGAPVPINTRLNVYTLLYYCKDEAHLTGEWQPFERLKDAAPFGPAFQKSITNVFAATFAGHTEALRAAFERMDGIPLSVSDVGYQVNGFECIPVRFHFWDADDEFPAQANLLFDTSCTDFIHVESVVTIASEGLVRIAQRAGLPMAKGGF